MADTPRSAVVTAYRLSPKMRRYLRTAGAGTLIQNRGTARTLALELADLAVRGPEIAPGRWRWDLTPYGRQVLDLITPRPTEDTDER